MDDDLVIQADGVTKRYRGGAAAVSDLTLHVPRGCIYGFVGRNGAGKTTTMRMLTGLVRPTSGRVRVLGRPPGAPAALARIGSVIEAPTFYPHLSGLDNLRLVALYAGVPETAVRPVLAEVGLSDRAGSRFRTYSLGMKQRLGLAAALLKDPELLILDEPSNGLDPPGRAAIRDLIHTVGRGRRTVLLSSHLLGEVEQICDRVAVIDAGRLVGEGTVAQLRAATGQAAVLIAAAPAADAAALLRRQPEIRDVGTEGPLLRVTVDPQLAGELNRRLVAAGITVSELRATRPSLEDVFFDLTQPAGDAPVAVPPAGSAGAPPVPAAGRTAQ